MMKAKHLRSAKVIIPVVMLAAFLLVVAGKMGYEKILPRLKQAGPRYMEFITYQPIPLGEGYFYKRRYKSIIGGVDIPQYIESYRYDDHYIVAKQCPKGKGKYVGYELPAEVYKNGSEKTYYWIIDKRKDELKGPLTYEDFRNETKKRGIGLSL